MEGILEKKGYNFFRFSTAQEVADNLIFAGIIQDAFGEYGPLHKFKICIKDLKDKVDEITSLVGRLKNGESNGMVS
mgnify:CR=1 FL=1